MVGKQLGKFERVDLREMWEDESRDFTPWLAQEENLSLLGETIGIDLELQAKELFIGNYKADIVATDISNNQTVIIENQLEKSNHDHLGKIITYASGIGASVIVWICKAINDEHRQAIDWLNENTNADINLFGLEIEFWRIDDSPPAPKFNIICSPNEWTQSAKESIAKAELSETKQLQLEFWGSLKEYMNRNKTFLSLRRPRAQHWYSMAIGRSKFNISLTTNTISSRLGCEIYMRGDTAKDAFRELRKEREQIEKEMGTELNWQELPEGQDCRIILHRDGDIKERENWNDYFSWFKIWAESFFQAFGDRIRKLEL